MCPFKCPPEASTVKAARNNKVDKMTSPVDVRQSPSLVIWNLPNRPAHVQSDFMCRMKTMHILNTMVLPSSRLISFQHWVSNMPPPETNADWHPSLGHSPATRQQAYYIRSFWPWSDQWFVTTGWDTHFRYIFVILTQTASVKATIDGLTEYLFRDCGSPYSAASN